MTSFPSHFLKQSGYLSHLTFQAVEFYSRLSEFKVHDKYGLVGRDEDI